MGSKTTPNDIIKKTLPNGLTVIFRQDRSNPVVAVNVWFKIGSAHESDEMSGLAHFQEHMVFKGTEKHGVGEIANIVKSAGGNLNAGTSYSYTMYYVVLPAKEFSLALNVQADAMMNSTFDPDEFTKERLVVIDEARMYDDTPDSFTYYRAMELGFDKHNYRRPIAGYEPVVSAFTRDQLLDFYNSYYRPGNAVLVVVGDIDPDTAFKEIEAAYGSWSNGKIDLPESPEEPKQKSFRFKTLRGSIDHAYLGYGFHVPSILDDDYAALEVLSTLLGAGKSSRLYRKVLEEKQLVTTVSASMLAEKWPGYMMVYASTPAQKWQEARDAIFSEMMRFAAEPVSEDELLKARRQVEKWMYSDLETVEGQASNLGYYEVMGDYRMAEEHRRAIQSVTAAGVMSVARKYLTLDNCSLISYLPENGDVPEATLEETEKTFIELAPSLDVALESVNKTAPKPTEPDKAEQGADTKDRIRLIELENGLRVLVKRRTTVPMVSVLTAYQGGARIEPKGKTGLSLLASRALLKETPSYNAEEIVATIEGLGGSIESISSFDLSGVYLNILSDHLGDAMGIYKEVLREPTFADEIIEQEKTKLLEELVKRHDHPVYYSVDNLFTRIFGDHPYAYPFIGDGSGLEALTAKDCREWYEKNLSPANTVMVFVGNITEDEAVEAARNLFGDVEPAPVPRSEVEAPTEPVAPGLHVLRRKDINQAVGLVGFVAPPMMSDEAISLRVLDGLMTGLGGRLFYELRDQRSLGYMAGSAFMPLKERSVAYGYSNPKPEGIDEAIEVILSEFEKVTREPVTDMELNRSKNWLIGSQLMKLQRNLAQAIEYGFYEALGFGYEMVDKTPGLIEQVTKQDILVAAAGVFDRKKAVCTKLIPEEEAGE